MSGNVNAPDALVVSFVLLLMPRGRPLVGLPPADMSIFVCGGMAFVVGVVRTVWSSELVQSVLPSDAQTAARRTASCRQRTVPKRAIAPAGSGSPCPSSRGGQADATAGRRASQATASIRDMIVSRAGLSLTN